MKKMTWFNELIRIIIVFIVALLAFAMASKLMQGVGNMPQFMMDAYDSSIFVKSGTKTIAMVGLCMLIIGCLIGNFYFAKEQVCKNKVINGFLYGGSFGIVWFFGFMEMNTINNDNVLAHFQSGIRDLIVLSLVGVTLGLLFAKEQYKTTHREKYTCLAIPLVAVGFAIFHTIQLSITFQEVAEFQRIDSIIDVIWLLGFGAWIGSMYVIFHPGFHIRNRYLRSLHFAFVFFGSNWILFNLFYNIFLDIPLADLAIRCLSDCIGVLVGLLLYEFLSKKLSASKKQHSCTELP